MHDFCRKIQRWNSGWWQKPAGSFFSLVEVSSGTQESGETGRTSFQEWCGISEGESVAVSQASVGKAGEERPLELVTDWSGFFLHSKQFIRSQIVFPFILRPGCVQDIVMKGSSQAVEADVCACRIFTEQMWKEGKRRTFSPDWALFLKEANICLCKLCLQLPLPSDQHGFRCVFAVFHNTKIAGCQKASFCWPAQENAAAGEEE